MSVRCPSLRAAREELPENLTHCGCCGVPFTDGPVTNWDDFFVAIEDVSFYCSSCAESEGLTT